MAHAATEVALRAEEKARLSDCRHPKVLRMQQEPLCSELQTWVRAGACFEEKYDAGFLPELRAFLAELKMKSLNSRYVEAEHAKVQVGLRKAPHHSDAYVSLLRRMCGLTKEIKQNPPVLQDLAKHLESVRSGRDAVRILWLDRRRSFVPGCRDRVEWSIVYHADAYTKFTMPDPDLFFQTGPPPQDEPGHKRGCF